jgi:hypothetical protein
MCLCPFSFLFLVSPSFFFILLCMNTSIFIFWRINEYWNEDLWYRSPWYVGFFFNVQLSFPSYSFIGRESTVSCRFNLEHSGQQNPCQVIKTIFISMFYYCNI